MRPLMPPVQTPDNLFHDGNPLTGELGTIVDAEHLNNVQGAVRDAQSELITVLNAAGINVDPSKQNQLLTALKALLLSRSNPFGDIKSDGTVKKALENLGLVNSSGAIGRLVSIKKFTVSGTYTPTAGTKFIRVRLVGAGGAGGGAAASTVSGYLAAGRGGGGGSYGETTLIDVTSVLSVAVIVG
ncbi:TPA: hypothetical protein ACG0MC_001965, partial [Enterobacter kobei]